jgi:hypothetical protein
MGRVIGNEIFKTIVMMAYEMKLASRVLSRMTHRREKVRKLMKAGQTFRDDEDIRKEMAKYLAISPDNKKHWRFDEGAEDTEHNGFVLKKEIALSVSGRYRIMLSIVKHTEYEVAQHRQFENVLYVHIRDSDDEEVNEVADRRYYIRNPPTVVTVEIIKRLGLCLESREVKEAYDEIYERVSYYSRRSGINAYKWDRRITAMRDDDKRSGLVKTISRRYGEDV